MIFIYLSSYTLSMERARIIEDLVQTAAITRAPIFRADKRTRHVVMDPYEVYQLARLGCTQDECAQFYGVSISHVEKVLRDDVNIRYAWDRGSAQSKISLRRQQIIHSQRPDASGVAMTIHMSKHHLNEVDRVKQEVTGANNEPVKITFAFDGPGVHQPQPPTIDASL